VQPQQDRLDRAQRVTEERQPRWRRRPVVLIAVVLFAIAFTQTPPGRGVLRLAGLQSPPAYTALYFTNPDRLPTQLRTGHVQLPVSFTVQNSSRTAKTYQWRIDVQDGKNTAHVAAGQFSLPGGGTAAETKAVKTVCRSGGGLRIIVSLAAPANSIDFRVVCRA
jgi:hypothetical protein